MRILICVPDYLGWRTLAASIAGVGAQRDDVSITVAQLQGTILERLFMRQLPGRTLRRPIDPILIWRRVIRRWWRRSGAGIDAVHVASQIHALGFCDLIAPSRLSVTVDMPRRANREFFGPADFTRRALAAEARVLTSAAFVAPMSSWASRALQDGYGIDGARIMVLPPSVPIPTAGQRFLEQRRARRERGDPVKLLFVGNDFHRKGGDRLVVWHQTHFCSSELHIVSAGAPDLSLPNVHVYRNLPNDTVVGRLMPSMDIFCLPTRADMSPWVLSEAGASGLPVLATDMGGMPDLVKDGVTGYLVDPRTPEDFVARLGELIRWPDIAVAMGEAAHSHAAATLNGEVNYQRLIDRIVSEAGGTIP